jgi:Skp family chaperone for outer membrane proteins
MPLSRNRIVIAIVAVVLIAAAGAAYFFLRPATTTAPATAQSDVIPDTGAGKAAPQPKIVVLDLAAVMRVSKVGQDISSQLQSYATQTKANLSGRGQALENEAKQISALPPEQKQQRVAAFQAKQAAFQQEVQGKETQMKTAFAQAQGVIGKALDPILKQITAERGANLVLEKRAVPILEDASIDITAEAIAKLDAKMPSYKVTIPPAGQN